MADNPIADALNRIIRHFDTARERFQEAMTKRQGTKLAKKALRALKTRPGPPIYKLRWKSPRQRAAFFATNGFGGGIPYQRKYTIADGWDAEFVPTKDGGILAITNPSNKAQFVHGPNTQPFHLDTGWVQLDDVAQDALDEMEGVATEVWYAESDPLEVL